MKTKTTPRFLLSMLFLIAVAHAADSTRVRPTMQAVRIEGDITLSGKLDDPRWKQAVTFAMPYEIDPGENIPAAQNTTARILYNSDYIYVGFDCNDSVPSAIRANIADRDRIFLDDFAIIFFDTYGDNQRAYEFLVNPFGIQGDIFRNGNNEDDSFDAVWESKANINDHGWTAEMAIPFKSLRFPAKEEQRWNILVGRQYPRANKSIFSWTAIERNNPCLVCQGGFLEGIHGIQATNAAEILPYVLGSQNSALNDESDPRSPFNNDPAKVRIGGSVKSTPSPAFALEGVVNPDFSQVETDAAQISVNQTFALFFPERRPFFIEGADLFQNRLSTYYSRTINNPIGAVKVTGKASSISFGLIAAEDRSTIGDRTGEESSSDPIDTKMKSLVGVGRLRYEFGDQASVGAMLSSRTVTGAGNYNAGVDFNYLFWGNNYLRGELFASSTKEINDTNLYVDTQTFGSTLHDGSLNGESYNGTAMRLEYRHEGRDHFASVTYQDISPLFQAQNGFVTQTNFRNVQMEHDYTLYFKDSFVSKVFFYGVGGMKYNYDDVLKERFGVAGFGLNMQGQTYFNMNYLALNQERFKGVWFNNVPRFQFNLSTTPIKAVSAGIYASVGDFIYRDTPEVGNGHQAGVNVSLRPTSQFRLDLSYDRAGLASNATGALFYDGNIYRAVGSYQFTAQMFLRAIVQYESFGETFSLYPLFSYKVNPFTIFYAGFTDNRSFFGGTDGFQTTARQFFVKFQYLLRS